MPKKKTSLLNNKNTKSKFFFELTDDHYKIVELSNANQRGRLEMWQFLIFLLNNSTDTNINCGLHWVNEDQGIFQIENAKKIAALWGIHKQNPSMSYESMSRNLRY